MTSQGTDSELAHKHIFEECLDSYTLICRCGVEISITSMPTLSQEGDNGQQAEKTL